MTILDVRVTAGQIALALVALPFVLLGAWLFVVTYLIAFGG